MLKLNRKLQPMVDGMDANRNKWLELSSSNQETRRASVSNQSEESDQSPEPHEAAVTNEHPDSTETLKPVENTMFGSKSKSSQDLRFRVNQGSCDDQPESAGNIISAGKK